MKELMIAIYAYVYWKKKLDYQGHRRNRVQMAWTRGARFGRCVAVERSKQAAMRELGSGHAPLFVRTPADKYLRRLPVECGHSEFYPLRLNGTIQLCNECYNNDILRNQLVERDTERQREITLDADPVSKFFNVKEK